LVAGRVHHSQLALLADLLTRKQGEIWRVKRQIIFMFFRRVAGVDSFLFASRRRPGLAGIPAVIEPWGSLTVTKGEIWPANSAKYFKKTADATGLEGVFSNGSGIEKVRRARKWMFQREAVETAKTSLAVPTPR
jgi:hypothetical protein